MNKFNQEIQQSLRDFFNALKDQRPAMTDMAAKLVTELDAEEKNPAVFLPSVIDTVKELARIGIKFSQEIRDSVEDPSEIEAIVSIDAYTPELKARLDDDVVQMAEECLAYKLDTESELLAKHGGNGDPFTNYMVQTDSTQMFFEMMSSVTEEIIDKVFGELTGE